MPSQKITQERAALGRRIAQARERMKLTQTEAADRLDITVQSLQQWEKGLTSPRPERLKQIAAVFHCTVDDLFGGQALPQLLHKLQLVDGEETVLEQYRLLPPPMQAHVRALLDYLLISMPPPRPPRGGRRRR